MLNKNNSHKIDDCRSKINTLCDRLADIPCNHREFEPTDMPFVLRGKLDEWENLIAFGIPESLEHGMDDDNIDQEIELLAAALNLSPEAFQKRFPQPTSREEYINTMILFTLSKEQRDCMARSAQHTLHAFSETPSKIQHELESIMEEARKISQRIDQEIVALLEKEKKIS